MNQPPIPHDACLQIHAQAKQLLIDGTCGFRRHGLAQLGIPHESLALAGPERSNQHGIVVVSRPLPWTMLA